MTDEFEHRRILTLDIVNANKGEEPFVSFEAFSYELGLAWDAIIKSKAPEREAIVRLLASHHWVSWAHRREFKNQVFGLLYSGIPMISEDNAKLNDMPLNSTETTPTERTTPSDDPCNDAEAEDADMSVPADMLGDMLMQQRNHMIEYQQKYLQNGYGYSIVYEDYYGLINSSDVQDVIRQTNCFLIEELMEAQNLLKAKPWKMNPQPTKIDEYHKEIGDAIHFFLELLIYSGLDTPEKVWEVYSERSANNTKRRATDY